MQKCKYAIVGTGWRAEFFMRAAQYVPEQFELTGVYTRSEEKAKELHERLDVKMTTDMDELLAAKPDFVVLCVNRKVTMGYFEMFMKLNVPVLCETPPAESQEDLYKLWEMAQQYDAKIQVAEQYHRQPLYYSWMKVVKTGMIGEVSNMTLSSLHGYHAVAVMREILGVGMDKVKIYGKRHVFPVVETDSRYGMLYTGNTTMKNRDILTLEFENGTVGFYNFTDAMYHSQIRTRHINIQGLIGEIDDMDIRYINEDGDTVLSSLVRRDRGRFNNREWALSDMSLNGKILYKNPFNHARLNDDELAVTDCMWGMKEYLETGKDMYSLKDGLQDSIISQAMYKVLDNNLGEITVDTQPWA